MPLLSKRFTRTVREEISIDTIVGHLALSLNTLDMMWSIDKSKQEVAAHRWLINHPWHVCRSS